MGDTPEGDRVTEVPTTQPPAQTPTPAKFNRSTLNPGRDLYKTPGETFSRTRNRNSGLNPRQHKFAHLYLKYLNATKAAREAGYSPNSADDIGCQLLANPKIKVYIESLQRRIAVQIRELTPERIASELWHTAQVCAQAEPVLDRQGQPTGEYRIDSAGRNKALELLGRYKGMFQDKVDVLHTLRVEDLSEDQIMALLGRLDQLKAQPVTIDAKPEPDSVDISKA